MTNYQIYKKGNSILAIDADKFTARDDMHDAMRDGYSSAGLIEAETEKEAIENYEQDPSSVIATTIREDEQTTQVSSNLADVPKVSVVDINMPFGSLVMFMVKWALASIPAMIILTVFYALFLSIMGGFL